MTRKQPSAEQVEASRTIAMDALEQSLKYASEHGVDPGPLTLALFDVSAFAAAVFYPHLSEELAERLGEIIDTAAKGEN